MRLKQEARNGKVFRAVTVATSFFPGDAEVWFKQMAWLEQLSQRPVGGLRDTPCVLVTNGVVGSMVSSARKQLKSIFGQVEVIRLNGKVNTWPAAQNLVFKTALSFVSGCDDMLWTESDVVFLKDSWLSDLLREWDSRLVFHKFMGALIETTYCNHVSGVAIYGSNWKKACPSLVEQSDLAWDVACARDILPYSKFTTTIQQVFGSVKPPEIGDIRPGACLFHQDKSGHLIDLLRAKLPPIPKPKTPAASILKWDALK